MNWLFFRFHWNYSDGVIWTVEILPNNNRISNDLFLVPTIIIRSHIGQSGWFRGTHIKTYTLYSAGSWKCRHFSRPMMVIKLCRKWRQWAKFGYASFPSETLNCFICECRSSSTQCLNTVNCINQHFETIVIIPYRKWRLCSFLSKRCAALLIFYYTKFANTVNSIIQPMIITRWI